MILKNINKRFKDYSSNTFITQKQLLKVLEHSDFREDLIKLFDIKEDESKVLQIGNSKYLIESLLELDSLCDKIDIPIKMKNVYLEKLLEDEKAIFSILGVENKYIYNIIKSDKLKVETAYSAKQDLLDYYNFSKFANYCRDLEYEDLIKSIRDYLKEKNKDNNDEINLRLLYEKEDKKFYLRAITSTNGYKDFGINFSVFVILVALGKYVEDTKNNIHIDRYVVNDSKIYVSFSLSNSRVINDKLNLNFNLILENDEIKRDAVRLNGVFKITYKENNRLSEIFIKPKGMKKEKSEYPVDLLQYRHTGNPQKVYESIQELPKLIDFFIEQVSDDAKKISEIKNVKDVRTHLANKVKHSRKLEFQKYKERIFRKLMEITADNTFNLFEVFRQVEELFENEDVISRDYWREKLYESLIEKK